MQHRAEPTCGDLEANSFHPTRKSCKSRGLDLPPPAAESGRFPGSEGARSLLLRHCRRSRRILAAPVSAGAVSSGSTPHTAAAGREPAVFGQELPPGPLLAQAGWRCPLLWPRQPRGAATGRAERVSSISANQQLNRVERLKEGSEGKYHL